MKYTTSSPDGELRYYTGTSASIRSGHSVGNLRRLADAGKISVLRTVNGTRVYMERDLDRLRDQRRSETR